MIVESSPQYGVARGGLGANYNINFGSDVAHQIPLFGTFQGDPVQPQTLFVDNYSSAYAINVTDGNFVQKVPAFSAAYLDIRQSGYVNVTAESASADTVAMSVWNFRENYRVDTRTFQAASLTSDQYWNKVNLALHCDGQNNVTSVFDDKSQTYFGTTSGALSTNKFKFGNASLFFPAAASNGSFSLNTVQSVSANGFSIDFFFLIDGAILSGALNLFGLYNATAAAYPTYGITIVNGNIAQFNVFDPISGNVNLNLNTPISLNGWHYLAINSGGANNFSAYIDSEYCGNFSSSGTIGGGTGPSQLYLAYTRNQPSRFDLYYDEIRVTSYPRFISSAPIPTQSFFNQ